MHTSQSPTIIRRVNEEVVLEADAEANSYPSPSNPDANDVVTALQSGGVIPTGSSLNHPLTLSEVNLVASIGAAGEDTIIIVSDGNGDDAAHVVQDHMDTAPMPLGCIWRWIRPSGKHPSAQDIKARFSTPVTKIVCVDLTDLVDVLKRPSWISEWKQMLQPGGTLILELERSPEDVTWQDTASRYGRLSYLRGFRLHSVNTCLFGIGNDNSIQRKQMASAYRRLSSRLSRVEGDRYARSCDWLDEAAGSVATIGIQREDRLFGLFVQCYPDGRLGLD